MKGDQLLQGNTILRRWAVALILLTVVPLALSFNARMATIRQMRQDETRLKQIVTAEETRQADLKQQLDDVRSDEYAKHWARVDAKMSKPGEVPVILAAPNDSLPTPAKPVTTQAPTSILDEWWAVFFGDTSEP